MGKVTTLNPGAATGDMRAALAAYLDEAGLTVTQAAREIGRRESTISRWPPTKAWRRTKAQPRQRPDKPAWRRAHLA